jgi:hypothetical protein
LLPLKVAVKPVTIPEPSSTCQLRVLHFTPSHFLPINTLTRQSE